MVISRLILLRMRNISDKFAEKTKTHFLCSNNVFRKSCRSGDNVTKYRVFNLKVDRQLSREYFTSDAIYNGSAGMTLYYYMCRSWQDSCRRGENRCLAIRISWISRQWVLVFETTPFLHFHNAVNSGRTYIYLGKLFKNDVLRPL